MRDNCCKCIAEGIGKTEVIFVKQQIRLLTTVRDCKNELIIPALDRIHCIYLNAFKNICECCCEQSKKIYCVTESLLTALFTLFTDSTYENLKSLIDINIEWYANTLEVDDCNTECNSIEDSSSCSTSIPDCAKNYENKRRFI